MNPNIKGLILGCAVSALSGCSPDVVGPMSWGDSPQGGAGCYTYSGCAGAAAGFILSPDSAHILLGDTTTFYTSSCPNGPYCPNAHGTIVSRWSIAGDAVTSESFDGQRSTTNPSAVQILVRAIAPGASDITAVSFHDSTKSRTVRVIVADSSAITAIDMTLYSSDTLRWGESGAVYAKLLDSEGNRYRAGPTWSVSDTTVLKLRQDEVSNGVSVKFVRAMKVGSADVTARFLGLSSTVRITVVP